MSSSSRASLLPLLLLFLLFIPLLLFLLFLTPTLATDDAEEATAVQHGSVVDRVQHDPTLRAHLLAELIASQHNTDDDATHTAESALRGVRRQDVVPMADAGDTAITLDCDAARDSLLQPFACPSRKSPREFGAVGRQFVAERPELAQPSAVFRFKPVVLIPGLGGSSLEAALRGKKSVPSVLCSRRADWFNLWFSVKELFVQECWFDNLRLIYDAEKDTYTSVDAVETRPRDFGGLSGIDYLDRVFGSPNSLAKYFAELVATLLNVGYTPGKNLRGAPYDWRRPLNNKGSFNEQLRQLIEAMVRDNGERVVLVGHSMGGPTSLHFLNSQSPDWIKRHVDSIVTLGAPWLGATKALRALINGDDFGVRVGNVSLLKRDLIRTHVRRFGGVVNLIPSLTFPPSSGFPNGRPFVRTPKRDYHARDFDALFEDLGLSSSTGKIYERTRHLLQSLSPPPVPVHCLYGHGVPTERVLNYRTLDQLPADIEYDDGDGTVPVESLQACTQWSVSHKTEVHERRFHGVNHMQVLDHADVHRYLLEQLLITGRD